jgi:hypothetical protein
MGISLRFTTWFSRIVLAAATLLFSMIAAGSLFDPIASSAARDITLGSAAGITVVRVGLGGFPLVFAIILAACLVTDRRIEGLSVLVLLAVVVTSVRFVGLALDGPAPFTLHVLKPEIGMIVLSTLALFLERRLRHGTSEPGIARFTPSH